MGLLRNCRLAPPSQRMLRGFAPMIDRFRRAGLLRVVALGLVALTSAAPAQTVAESPRLQSLEQAVAEVADAPSAPSVSAKLAIVQQAFEAGGGGGAGQYWPRAGGQP